jgi:uncharacterized RDD family membrane protein YckC/ribosomal protein S27AE
MDWYYAADGKQAGPVNDAALADLVRTGVVRAETLVWHSALPNWLPYGQVAAAAAAAPPPSPVGTAPAGPMAVGGTTFCSECGRPFSANDLVRFGDRWICGNCKELFAQKLREGVAPQGSVVYGGFWIRFLAVIIDGAILLVVSMLVNKIVIRAAGPSDIGAAMAMAGLAVVIQLAIAASYEGVFVGRFGATPGKMALHLKVVMPDGRPVSMGRAFGRYFAKFLSSFTIGIGYIMAGFDQEKRALHDYICSTRVIRTLG